MSDQWNEWRVIITATQQADYVLRTESQGEPVVGPNGEPIDMSKSRIIGHRDELETKIKQMNILTGGKYQMSHTKVIAPPNQITYQNYTFPVDVNLISASFFFKGSSKGDIISWSASPFTTAGVLDLSASVGDTTLTVSQTVINNIDNLFRIRLALASDPENTYENVGKVIYIDKENLTITVDTPLVQNWDAGTTLVQITQIFIDNMEIGPLDTRIDVGKDTTRTSYIPAGNSLQCEYKNMHPTETHELYVYFSYLYGKLD